MQLRIFWATLVKRWYLLAVALLATGAVAVVVVRAVGPTYEAEGSVLIFPPITTVERGSESKTVGNPYLELGGLNQARDVVIRAITSKGAREDLCKRSGDAAYEALRAQLCIDAPTVTYEVTPDFTNSAPIILVTLDAKSPTVAVTGLAAVMDQVPSTLNTLQSGLDLRPRSTITSMPLTADKTPDVVRKYQIRAGLIAGAGVFVVSLLTIALIDAMLAVRKARVGGGRRAALDVLNDEVSPPPRETELMEWPEEEQVDKTRQAESGWSLRGTDGRL